ncbi:MAG: hypothetical protein QNK03_01570 [Myxococcota bacterium]|nr:hypothetical protein [Myxococcota bacterium]
MALPAVLRALGPIDLRSIGRESFLWWLLALPVAAAAGLRWGVPALDGWLLRTFAFDFTPYHPLVFAYFVVLFVPMIVGQVVGFRLLDERDDDTLRALLVTPLSLEAYLVYRIGVPLMLCTALSLLSMPFLGLFEVAPHRALAVALMAALGAPIFALAMSAVATNKVQGFAFMKAASGLQLVPIAAWFVAPPWQYLAAFLPSYWPLKALLAPASDGLGFALWLLGGLAAHALVLLALLRRFGRVARR